MIATLESALEDSKAYRAESKASSDRTIAASDKLIANLQAEVAVLHGFLTVRFYLERIGEKFHNTTSHGIRIASEHPDFVEYLQGVAASRTDCTFDQLMAATCKVYGSFSGNIHGRGVPTFTLQSSVPAHSFVYSTDVVAVSALFKFYGPGNHISFTLHDLSPVNLPPVR